MPTVGGLVIEISTNVAKLQSDMGRVRQSLNTVEATTRNLNRTSQGVFDQLKSGWVGIASKVYLVEQALSIFNRTIGAVFIKGLKAVDDYKMGVASSAAVIMTFMEKQKGEDLGSQWKRASDYAEGIVPTLEKIAALTLLSGKETQMLFTEFAKGGVFLDALNEKAVKGFSAVSNTIAIMTKGQDTERQILTEVRALMEGQAKAGSVLIKMLEAIDPKLKDHLKTWQAEGTTLEHLGVLLQGFDAASGQLQLTWQTIKSTLQTTVEQVLRGGMMKVYEELMRLALKLNIFLEDHQEIIKKGIYQGWIVTKSAIESIYKIYQEMKPILLTIGNLVGKIVEGWALLLTISPPIIDRLIAISKLMSMTWSATHGDIQGAKDAYNEYIKLQDKHILGGKTLGSEIEERVNKYYADIAKIGGGLVKPPKAMALQIDTEEASKKLKKFLSESKDEVAHAFRLLEEIFWPLKTFADTIADKIKSAYGIIEDALFKIYDFEKFRKNHEEMLKMIQEEKDAKIQAYEDSWSKMFEMANALGGDLGQGMGQVMAGVKGMTDMEYKNEEWTQIQEYYANRIQALIDMKASEARINEEYNNLILASEQMTNLERVKTYQSTTNMIMGTLTMLGSFIKGNNAALFLLQKAAAIAITIVNAHAAAVAAVAPPPMGLGPVFGIPLAAKMMTFGYINAGIIAATAIGQMAGGGGGGAPSGGTSGGGYAYTQPTEPAWQSQKEIQRSQNIIINVNGNIIDHAAFVRELAPYINEARGDNVVILER